MLDAERIHARWKWICGFKGNRSLQCLNAMLRLMQYIEANQTFPSQEELLPSLQAERLQHKLSLGALEEDVALGWRHLNIVRMLVVVVVVVAGGWCCWWC